MLKLLIVVTSGAVVGMIGGPLWKGCEKKMGNICFLFYILLYDLNI